MSKHSKSYWVVEKWQIITIGGKREKREHALQPRVLQAAIVALRPLDQAGCKSKNVHEWQGLEEESQQANPQDRPPQYFSKNLSYTGIEPILSEDFSPRHLKPYQITYAPEA
ncbi:Uncharacterized protein Fot_51234 [Forsythia ovata]|uniref:Uncharacterized protein n=1 Tax=Forsythia ovata TaxID=205694 RepID=A0ABD1PXQ7_9LAMI